MAMNVAIKLKRDTAANWASANPILEDGQPGYDSTNNQIRIGNGVSTWSALPILAASGSGANLTWTASTRTVASDSGTDAVITVADGTNAGLMTSANFTKLAGVATGATANSSDATLLNRTNHTGTQASTTISDFSEAVDDRVNALVVAGTNMTITYNDGANTLTFDATGGGGGATNLTYTAATRVMASDTGTDATIPLFTSADPGLTPLSGGGTTNFLRADGSWAAPPGGGGSTLLLENVQSGTTYTFVATDVDKMVSATNAGTKTFTIPLNAVTAMSVGSQIAVRNIGAGNLTVTIGSPGTINTVTAGSIVAAQNEELYLWKNPGTDAWEVVASGAGTNLTWTASTSTVASNTGTDAVLTVADGTNPGLMSSANFTKLAGITGTNTGDQTSIVGITGTKAQFDTAVTDGNILYVGDVTSNATHTGEVTGSTALTIANDVVTYAKMQNVSAASKLLGRGDSGSGDPQEITLGTNLSMSGTTLNATGGSGSSLLIENIQSGSTYTIVATDVDKMVSATFNGTKTFTLPLNSVTAITVGSQIAVRNVGTGNLTLTIGSPGTINGVTAGSVVIASGEELYAWKNPSTDAWEVSEAGAGTDLGYTASTRVLTSNTGTDVTLPLFTTADPGLTPLSGGGTTNFLRADGSWAAPPGGVTDGDKGDITVSGTGATWTIDNGVVSLAKMANMATSSLIYRKTAGSGAPEVQTLATLKTDLGLTGTNSGDQTITLTGDVGGSGTGSFAATIANDAVTNVKLANVATATIKGRVTAATGDPEDLTGTQATTLLDTFTTALKGLAPASGGGTTNYLRADGTWAAPAGGGGGVSDGDKGDITVSSSGAVWVVDDEIKYGYAVAARQNIGMF